MAITRLIIGICLLLAGLLSVSSYTWAKTVSSNATDPAAAVAGIPRFPFPQHIPRLPGTIRPNHISGQEQDRIVGQVYHRWKQAYIVPVQSKNTNDPPMFRVTAGDRKPQTTFSEGQGYGMILTALMAGYDPQARRIFDGLWRFARAHPSRLNPRFMAYQVPVSRSRRNSAFDGDCDMAYALLLAHDQWGSTVGIDYRREALAITEALLATAVGPESRLPMLGDWVKPNGRKFNQYTTRASDIIPGHFRAFAQATGNTKWTATLKAGQRLVTAIQSTAAPHTGLLPDFIVNHSPKTPHPRPAPSRFLESAHDGRYYYNAARVPWRIGTHALLTGDPQSLQQVRKIAVWIHQATAGDPSRIKPGYHLDGRSLPKGQYPSTAFIAPFGVAAMTTPAQQAYLNRIFEMVQGARQDYYEDTIGLLCLLVLTGNFWDPH